ncbi:unnamed protein product [Adineta steineri]|uniref:F-box domain-containing protein n=1 Tax=Adineta steineri TaxID=433720 RepID=A0A814W0B0_9BILA|nr:unnamed protein product [Adineta steineri]CAF1195881.1 unnamed protein product [Adineta steineri]
MNQSKRQLTINGSNKKVRISKHGTHIEDLSNELIIEVFDYLDGCDLYKAFSKLNKRFQDILSCPYIRPKINIVNSSKRDILFDYTKIILPNKHQIVSICILNPLAIDLFSQTMKFDLSFHRLESVVLYGLKASDLVALLLTLISIPQLSLLIITLTDINIKDFSNAYRLIFSLPALKYNKLHFIGPTPSLYLTNINIRPSTITHLNIDHACYLNDVVHMLSYTPYLRRIVFGKLMQSYRNIEKITLSLPYLTHISIGKCYLQFDELDIFIKKISSQLQMLRISTCDDETYLDPDRWERLISKYIPYLRNFYFEYHQLVNDNFQTTSYNELIHRFTSEFWRERRWIFKLEMNVNFFFLTNVVYSIHPYRENWDEIHKEHWNSNIALDVFNGTELSIFESSFTDYNDSLIDNLAPLFDIVQITKLDFTFEATFVGMLLDLLRYLPNLNSLRVRSLSLTKPRCLHAEEERISRLISIDNKIRKVHIQQMTDLEQIQFLINICPLMQYLDIGFSDNMDLKLLLKFILMKNREQISHLRVLCLCTPRINQKMFEDLQNLVRMKKQYQKYTIKHINNRIYIQR